MLLVELESLGEEVLVVELESLGEEVLLVDWRVWERRCCW